MPAFLLKIRSLLTGTFQTQAGLRLNSLANVNGLTLLTGTGCFTGEVAKEIIFGAALDGCPLDVELSFETGERRYGKFIIAGYQCVGVIHGEYTYSLTLKEVAP